MFDPAGIGFAPREHRQFPVRTDFSKHRMNEENVMRMPGSSEAQRSRIRDEENIHERRPCWSWLIPFTAALRSLHHGAYHSGPDAFDGAAEINPNA
jgi:hypothetical protein